VNQDDGKPPTILSMEDIKLGLSDMARNGEGAQRAQAYRMLMNMESATVTLPEPMTYEEEIERLTRILKACGKEKVQVSWKRAWPTTKKTVDDDADRMTLEDLPPRIRFTAEHVTTLRKLYDMAPEIKPKGGFPSGYPLGKGKAMRCRWVQHQAAKILLDRWREEGGSDPSPQAPPTLP
jgi:hypothetical protein